MNRKSDNEVNNRWRHDYRKIKLLKLTGSVIIVSTTIVSNTKWAYRWHLALVCRIPSRQWSWCQRLWSLRKLKICLSQILKNKIFCWHHDRWHYNHEQWGSWNLWQWSRCQRKNNLNFLFLPKVSLKVHWTFSASIYLMRKCKLIFQKCKYLLALYSYRTGLTVMSVIVASTIKV